MLSLSVFVIAYNENKSLAAVVRDVHNTLQEENRQCEIVIIDDGSFDGTSEIADRLAQEIRSVSVVHHRVNYGLGSVYRTAFVNAKFDLVTFISADGQFSAQVIKQFLPLMDDTDMVLGYLSQRVDSFVSRLLSRAEKIIFRVLFGSMPKFQGMLMFRKVLLDEIELRSGGGRSWTVLMELIIKASRNGYRIVSVPIEMRKRISGKSKVNNVSTILANLRQAIVLRKDL